MEYGLLVMGAPYTSAAPHSALRFAKAVISRGHQVQAYSSIKKGFITPPA